MKYCKIDGCNKEVEAMGWCSKHYGRWRRHGDPLKLLNQSDDFVKFCTICECKNKFFAKGLCEIHYYRKQRNGSPNIVLPKGGKFGMQHKTTKKSIKSPTLADLHWAAGFCEGEANFALSHNKYQTISISQTECREPLQKMLNLFGGNIGIRNNSYNRSNGINARDAEVWYLCGSRARGLMMTIYSFMSPKRQKQIRAALEVA